MGKGRWLFVVFCVLSLFSCKEDKGAQQLLESIEQTWQECEFSLPKAQLHAETLKDSVGKSSAYVRQKYNLLTIRLRDKSDMVPSNPDSALQIMAYFGKQKNTIDKERACYYLGSAYRDLKDYPRAVNCFLETVEIAAECQDADTLVWQNALSQLRNLYMLQLNYEDELHAGLQAVELARQSGIKLGWYLVDVAAAYEHLGDSLLCLQYCDQAFQAFQKEQFPLKYGSSYAYMLTIYLKYNCYKKVDVMLQHLRRLPENQRPNNYELCLAKYHEYANQTDSAISHYKTYIDKVKTLSGRYEASAGLQRCYLQQGNFHDAALWGCRLYETNDSIIAQRAFEQTRRSKDAYIYYRDREKERSLILRDERIIFISVISVLTLLSILLAVLAFYYFRRKKFAEEIFGKDKLLEQRKMINRELTRIALMNNATTKAEDVIAHFHDIAAGKSALNDDSWDALMVAIETLYPGFLEAVQGRMNRQMREPLLRTICLMKIGLKPVQITKVMDAKMQTVWNRVKRAEEICGDLLSV